MVPSGRAMVVAACIASGGCSVTQPKATTTTSTFSAVYDSDGRLLWVSCVGSDQGEGCPMQIDRSADRQTFALPVGRTVSIADKPMAARVCVANDASRAAGCPIPAPPAPEPD